MVRRGSRPSGGDSNKGRGCRQQEDRKLKGAYTFTVGYHELAGTRVILKKPLLVLRKKDGGEGGPMVELEVIGVIRHRILFKDPPQGSHLIAAGEGEEGPSVSSDAISSISNFLKKIYSEEPEAKELRLYP